MDIMYSARREMFRRGFTNKTIKSYCFCLKQFLNKNSKDPRYITKKDVKEYLTDLAEKKRAGSTINLHYSAIKFLLEEVLRRNITLDLKFSRRPKKYPVVLTQEEIKQLINSIENKKHKLMVKLMYSAGLRVGELIRLRVEDLELDRSYGWVRQGKGRKDRIFIIAESLKNDLKEHIGKNKLEYDSFLFKGSKNRCISDGTISSIIKQATKKSGIKKNIHCHTLRHSFATHLIENGYSVSEVQSLLGHKNLETTMVYVHMTNPKVLNIKSPLDSL